MMTERQLAAIMPAARTAAIVTWISPLREAMAANAIDTTTERMAGFLASVSNETGQLQATKETTYFNTPYERVLVIFGAARSPSRELFEQWRAEGREAFYTKFFDYVYDDRRVNIGLGNLQDGDGSRYVGRGVGVTGRHLYDKLGRDLGVDLINNPDLLLEPKWAAASIALLWRQIGNNERMDRGDILAAMKIMNPGLPDFSNHLVQYRRALAVLRAPKPKPAPATGTEAATQVVTGKTGAVAVGGAVATTITTADAISRIGEAQATATAAKGFLATIGLPSPYTEIVLCTLTVAAIAFVLWRYGRKLLFGQAVST